MFIREDLGTSLDGLSTMLKERDSGTEEIRVHPNEIKFQLDSTDPTIKVGKKEFAATTEALQTFGDLVQIPSAFLKRAHEKAQASTLSALFDDMVKNSLLKDAKVTARGSFIQNVAEWGKTSITPGQIVDSAAKVLGGDAKVERLIDTPAFFGFDVRVPETGKKGVVSEGKATDVRGKKVNDVTTGGFRAGLNIKQGLAPSIEEWMFRLICTNGMTRQDSGLKVDARGQTVEQVLEEFESLAQLVMGRVEQTISHFYELREQPVDNVERTLRAIAREQGIPDRSTMALMELAVSEDMPDRPSMFDVVNLVTNFANSPAVNRDGGRLILEGAGGAVVSEHANRCGHCKQKVT